METVHFRDVEVDVVPTPIGYMRVMRGSLLEYICLPMYAIIPTQWFAIRGSRGDNF